MRRCVGGKNGEKKIQNPMRCPATLLPTLYRSSDSTKSTVERPPTQESAGRVD